MFSECDLEMQDRQVDSEGGKISADQETLSHSSLTATLQAVTSPKRSSTLGNNSLIIEEDILDTESSTSKQNAETTCDIFCSLQSQEGSFLVPSCLSCGKFVEAPTMTATLANVINDVQGTIESQLYATSSQDNFLLLVGDAEESNLEYFDAEENNGTVEICGSSEDTGCENRTVNNVCDDFEGFCGTGSLIRESMFVLENVDPCSDNEWLLCPKEIAPECNSDGTMEPCLVDNLDLLCPGPDFFMSRRPCDDFQSSSELESQETVSNVESPPIIRSEAKKLVFNSSSTYSLRSKSRKPLILENDKKCDDFRNLVVSKNNSSPLKKVQTNYVKRNKSLGVSQIMLALRHSVGLKREARCVEGDKECRETLTTPLNQLPHVDSALPNLMQSTSLASRKTDSSSEEPILTNDSWNKIKELARMKIKKDL